MGRYMVVYGISELAYRVQGIDASLFRMEGNDRFL